MRGKLVFAVGLTVGFVLGSRAGRERYEQIKEAAERLWSSRPVQAVSGKVSDAAASGVDGLKGQIVAGTANTVASVIGYEKSVTTKPAKPKASTAPKGGKTRSSAPRKVTPKRPGPSGPSDSAAKN